MRSLRDRRIVRRVSVPTLIVHDDLGLWKEPTAYPTLPDVQRARSTRCARIGLAVEPPISGEENYAGRC